MRVGVIGVGHVGLVTAASMADLGHDVVGMDDDDAKVALLRAGEMPFLEPGLEELVHGGVDAGRLRFTGESAEAVDGTDVVFICVGTPRRDDGAPNLSYVQAAATAVAIHATGPVVVAEKSTVPVQTGERIRQALRLHAQATDQDDHHDVVSNPEFLRESRAVEDTLRPDRIVVGADSEHGHAVMRELYAPLLERHPCPYVATDVRTAELIKHASNAFLATKISFINAVARICELAGADVEVIADAMGHDPRIGRQFLNAGLGYGGSCFPKDVQAYLHIASDLGYDFGLLRETERINREAKAWPLGDPREAGVKVGPLVNADAAAEVNRLVGDAVERGARLLHGGGTGAAYHEPTVLVDVPRDAEIVWEETFGPALTVLPVTDLDDAIDLSNRSRYGLDSAVFTSNLDRAWKAARALEVGMVHINDAPAHGVGHFPFGGRKPDSGIGREGLGYSIDECTTLKTVVLPADERHR
jgi:UDPglucose 6-dehydrogenase